MALVQDANSLWCPHCRRTTDNAPLPQLAADEAAIRPVAGDELRNLALGVPQGLARKHYCLDCRSIWESVQLPADFLRQLLDCRRQLGEQERELVALRFLLAQERRREAQYREAA
jgi:hypothetical protein